MPNTRADVFAGGPGPDGYTFKAEVYCPHCAEDLDFGAGPWDDLEFGDSEVVPQPVFNGEADTEQSCASCGEYLYGDRAEDQPDALLDHEMEDRLSGGGEPEAQ